MSELIYPRMSGCALHPYVAVSWDRYNARVRLLSGRISDEAFEHDTLVYSYDGRFTSYSEALANAVESAEALANQPQILREFLEGRRTPVQVQPENRQAVDS